VGCRQHSAYDKDFIPFVHTKKKEIGVFLNGTSKKNQGAVFYLEYDEELYHEIEYAGYGMSMAFINKTVFKVADMEEFSDIKFVLYEENKKEIFHKIGVLFLSCYVEFNYNDFFALKGLLR
jgi:hypothetical protein